MKIFLVTAALGAAMLSTAAMGQDGQGGRGHAMQDMTRAQALQKADDMFHRMDLDHNGVVTRAEAEQAARDYGGAKHLQRMIDKTFATAQSLTLQQFETQQLARFDRDDLNHDGVVTAAERQQARAMLKAQREGQASATSQMPPPPPGQ